MLVRVVAVLGENARGGGAREEKWLSHEACVETLPPDNLSAALPEDESERGMLRDDEDDTVDRHVRGNSRPASHTGSESGTCRIGGEEEEVVSQPGDTCNKTVIYLFIYLFIEDL